MDSPRARVAQRSNQWTTPELSGVVSCVCADLMRKQHTNLAYSGRSTARPPPTSDRVSADVAADAPVSNGHDREFYLVQRLCPAVEGLLPRMRAGGDGLVTHCGYADLRIVAAHNEGSSPFRG